MAPEDPQRAVDAEAEITGLVWPALFIGMGVLFTALILAAARGDLWLDEIWSCFNAWNAGSFGGVFSTHHDNNHVLNSLYVLCIGEARPLFLYRGLAILSGVGSLGLLGIIAWRQWGRRESIMAVLLGGCSYPLLLYFSEARGYGPAMFFSLACYFLLLEKGPPGRSLRMVLYGIAAMLALLSHLTSVMVLLALGCLQLAGELRAKTTWRAGLTRLLGYQAIPGVFLVGWYLYFVRHMDLGGGPEYRHSDVLRETAAVLLGLPDGAISGTLAVCLVVAAIGGGAFWLRRDRDPNWLLFPVVMVLTPALILVVTEPIYLHFRYFVVCFPFFYLLLAYLACRCHRAVPHRLRWLVIVGVAAVLCGHVVRIAPLIRHGRGHYTDALTQILAAAPPGPIRLGSDHDFRNLWVIMFYMPYLAGGDRIQYLPRSEWENEAPEWFLTHSLSGVPAREGFEIDRVGHYRLLAHFPSADHSRWQWFVYRRDPQRRPG